MSIIDPVERARLYADAIDALVSGGANVSYTVQGKTFTKANIGELERMYNTWAHRAASQSNGGVTKADFS